MLITIYSYTYFIMFDIQPDFTVILENAYSSTCNSIHSVRNVPIKLPDFQHVRISPAALRTTCIKFHFILLMFYWRNTWYIHIYINWPGRETGCSGCVNGSKDWRLLNTDCHVLIELKAIIVYGTLNSFKINKNFHQNFLSCFTFLIFFNILSEQAA